MNGCRWWDKYWQAGQRGELGKAEVSRFQAHRAACPVCQALQAQDQELSQLLQRIKGEAAPDGFNQAVWDKLAGLSPYQPHSFRPWPAVWASLAVAAAVLAVVVIFEQPRQQPKGAPAISSHAHPGFQPTVPVLQSTIQPEQQLTLGDKLFTGAIVQNMKRPMPRVAKKKTTSKVSLEMSGIKRMPNDPARGNSDQSAMSSNPPKSSRLATTQQSLPPVSAAAGAAHSAAAGNPVTKITPGVQQPAGAYFRLFNNTLHLNQQEKTRLEFVMPTSGVVWIDIFSREGRLVRKLLEENLAGGSYTVEWDGTTDQGQKVASGIYILLFKRADTTMEQRFKIAVIK